MLTRTDDAIDFDWGDGAPDFGVPVDRFSARWTRTKTYAAGTYRFSVTGDDGIRVLVDGAQVIDGWFYQAPTTYTADVPLTEGQHTVVVEYFEHTGGAVAKFSEAKLADEPPLQALSTEASADLTLSAPFGARPDPVIQAVRRLSPTGRLFACCDIERSRNGHADITDITGVTLTRGRMPLAAPPVTALGVNSATF